MNYYGIKSPPGQNYPIWWIGESEHNAWVKFLTDMPNRPPMEEAIRAYEAIGYSCVELDVAEKGAKE